MKRTCLALALATSAFAANAAGFTLSSPDIKPNATIKDTQVFNGFGCTGGNVSPALEWKNAPKGTKSFALQVHDPDAPTGEPEHVDAMVGALLDTALEPNVDLVATAAQIPAAWTGGAVEVRPIIPMG